MGTSTGPWLGSSLANQGIAWLDTQSRTMSLRATCPRARSAVLTWPVVLGPRAGCPCPMGSHPGAGIYHCIGLKAYCPMAVRRRLIGSAQYDAGSIAALRVEGWRLLRASSSTCRGGRPSCRLLTGLADHPVSTLTDPSRAGGLMLMCAQQLRLRFRRRGTG